MKVVRVIGGLGNQMFQYAFCLALKRHFPDEKIKMDSSLFNGYYVHNGYELDRVFSISFPKASFFDLCKVTVPTYHYKLAYHARQHFTRRSEYLEKGFSNYDTGVFQTIGNTYYQGYWQNEAYFHELHNELAKNFTFAPITDPVNSELLQRITSTDSVSIHIRRGDFLNVSAYKGICDLSYYKSAITYIMNKVSHPVFFIFSNDIEWCKANIVPLIKDCRYNIVTGNNGAKAYIDMQLMSKCTHQIIANSTFSWWSAYLNAHQNKLIIAPKLWTNLPSGKIQLDDWTLL